MVLRQPKAEFSPPSTIAYIYYRSTAKSLYLLPLAPNNSMSIPLRLLRSPRARGARSVRCFASSPISPGGRTAPYRRIHNELLYDTQQPSSIPDASTILLLLRSRTPSLLSQIRVSSNPRTFSTISLRFQEQRQSEQVRDPPRQDSATGQASGGDSAKSESGEKSKESSQESKANFEGSAGEGKDESSKSKKKEEDAPPPPPHGNKTPWQVFTETLKTEFQASKEWNESTKALASSAHQFTENESVKRARQAYTAASGTATSATASALKGTGKALGQGAAWTWDTPVVKGVRSSVNATASGIEKVTRPVRETKVYKTAVGSVKDVVDDGSSSRYGGWVEKEERRKQRELRELNEAAASGRPGRRPEKIEEDPK